MLGKKVSGARIRQGVEALTRTLPGAGQLSRLEAPVCPAVAGMTATQKARVTNRIRHVARETGIRTAKPGCRPNIVVIVTDDKRGLLDALWTRHRAYLGDMTNEQVRGLADQPDRAIAWRIAGRPVSADGTPLNYENRTTRQSSRISMASRPTTAAAVLVIERDAIVGLNTTQVADFTVMRTLLDVAPDAAKSLPQETILSLLKPDPAPPLAATKWDLAALRAVYSAPFNLRAPAERSAISETIIRELEMDRD